MASSRISGSSSSRIGVEAAASRGSSADPAVSPAAAAVLWRRNSLRVLKGCRRRGVVDS
jgi:hypothetical protein